MHVKRLTFGNACAILRLTRDADSIRERRKWNDYLLSSLFLQTQDMRTLPMMIRVFCAQYSTDYSPMMAGLVMSILPMLIFYLLCQKQILSGVVQGSVKG